VNGCTLPNSIIGYSEILIEGLAATEGQKYTDLISIRTAGHNLLELIDDLLELSKLEAGRMELQPERIEVRDLFAGLAAKWSPSIVDNGNEFRVEPPADAEIFCDAEKLQRVVESLLSNAAKFTKNGSVVLSGSMRAGVLAIVVEDTGIGIAENLIDKLFETFSNSENETASNYGDDVRLGLPLAHRYCRLMGGELSVQSRFGLGSRFTIQLPVQLMTDERPSSLRTELLTQAA
jgi:signal transduction histidine kinase